MIEQRTAQRWWAGIFLGLGLGLLTASVVLASGGEAAHGGGHGISESMMTDFIWRTVNFLVFAAILIKLVAKPAKAFFAKRSTDIGETFEELEAKKAEAEAALKAAEARLAEVGAEREKLMAQFLAEGELEKAKIIDKANQVAARIKDMAAHSIAQEFKKASLELKQEVAEQATRMAEELVKKEITFADQTTLVEEYLQKVVEKH
jgi:F-type H+-transporting ATPase subunit b